MEDSLPTERDTPRLVHLIRSGRSTGSRDLHAPPSQAIEPSGIEARWRSLRPPLAYRCGGSTGVEPVSRLTPAVSIHGARHPNRLPRTQLTDSTPAARAS